MGSSELLFFRIDATQIPKPSALGTVCLPGIFMLVIGPLTQLDRVLSNLPKTNEQYVMLIVVFVCVCGFSCVKIVYISLAKKLYSFIIFWIANKPTKQPVAMLA